jgi:cyclic beta-1,2-glucan synthetase
LADIADSFVCEMDFRFLHNPARKLLSIGYNVETGRLERACYDFLASEARTAVFLAIAKDDLRQSSWFHLGRAHIRYQGVRTLLSWSGTMFEYLMPALWMKSHEDTILGQSQRAAVRCHQYFGRKKGRPWGVSEAGFARKDAAGRYQYEPFGIPALALKTDVSGDVVAPYASFLALETDPEEAIRNLRRMKRMGWMGRYGFYESADYGSGRHSKRARYELVRSWMAHHQGMILMAVTNLLCGAPMQRRFHADLRVQATELLLHERAPESILVAPIDNPVTADTRLEPEEQAG